MKTQLQEKDDKTELLASKLMVMNMFYVQGCFTIAGKNTSDKGTNKGIKAREVVRIMQQL